MQQIYRTTPMPKCDFKKVAKQIRYKTACPNVKNYRFYLSRFLDYQINHEI